VPGNSPEIYLKARRSIGNCFEPMLDLMRDAEFRLSVSIKPLRVVKEFAKRVVEGG
jgi:hypothetical protein